MKARAALIVLGLVLAACSAGTADQEITAGTEDKETVFEPMTDAMDDAKAVEAQVMQQKKDIDAAVEEAAGNADDE